MSDHAGKGQMFELALEVWSRRRRLAVVAFALVFAGAVGVARFLPDIYRSTATVLVERHRVAETLVRPSVTSELEMRLQTINQRILSRSRLADLITRLGLYPDLAKRMPIEAVVERMRRDIQFELKGMEQTKQTIGPFATVAFNLSYRGRDPETVARVTNTLASFYVDENVKIREQQATGTAEFLKVQLKHAKERMDDQERRVRDFRTRHVGELPQEMAVNLATLQRLQAQLQLNSERQLQATNRRETLAKELGEVDPAEAAGRPDPTITKLTKLRLELLELRQRFSDKYPDVIRMKAEIAALERDLAEGKPKAETEPATSAYPSVRRLKVALNEADAELNALKTEQQGLRQDIAAYQRRIENAPQREQKLQELSRDYEMAKELYASLLKRHEDAQLAEIMERRQQEEPFRVLDPAIPAKHPVAPNRTLLILVGVLLALGTAWAAAALAEHLDTSFHTIDDLRSFTKVPVLASIPRIVSAGDTARRARQRWLATTYLTLSLALVVAASYQLAHENDELVRLLSRHPSASRAAQ